MPQLSRIRVAVVGAGAFGRNHLRVLREMDGASLSGVFDIDAARSAAAASEFACDSYSGLEELIANSDAAVIANPTTEHAETGCRLLDAGLDVLIEKPVAATLEEAQRLVNTARDRGRILQVGHLERFNPAVEALEQLRIHPLFFEIHRLSVFTPRSLDVDVVLDLMIHDLELVLALTGLEPEETRAAGIRILSRSVDIANVRLQFPGGCIANLTASRASTEQVRKLRVFAPHRYLSLDYKRQELVSVEVGEGQQISFRPVPVSREEPLKRELASFIHCIQTRSEPRVSGAAAMRALAVALNILDKIREHAEVVTRSVASR